MAWTSLRRELTLAILFKIVAIFLLWFWFFSPAHRIHVSPEDMTAALASRAPSHEVSGNR
ncbi:MAG: cytochrome oxidase putative small subunit CydP [Methylocystis sp.]|uniref:cytochrome oxidase putative small subunit CydP n=1 Tax=Methylocystis sp. TaxID=1911079 RepID=UPI003DA3A833